MKKITLILLLACSIAFAQEEISIKLGDFNTLKVYSGLAVKLQKSNESKIIITGPKASDVNVKNKNGTLKISFKFTNSFKKNDVNITIFYNEPITTLDVNEGASITFNEMLSQQNLELKAQEGGRITAILDVKYLTAKSISGSVISVSGTNQNQTIDANTGGIYKAFDLLSTQANATAASGGVINVQVKEVLNANVNFGGAIYYKGTPEELKTKKLAGGKIVSKN